MILYLGANKTGRKDVLKYFSRNMASFRTELGTLPVSENCFTAFSTSSATCRKKARLWTDVLTIIISSFNVKFFTIGDQTGREGRV